MKKISALLLALAMLLSLCACKKDPAPTGQTSLPPVAPPECSHADSDKDGICDLCRENVLITLDFYAINDLHGRFDDTDVQPGVDELSTYLDSMDDDKTVFLASGDIWQGSAESNLTYGALMTEWMNGMGFASMTLGNHEFDWGTEYIQANWELAEFPFLAINIFDRATGEQVEYCQSSVMIERSGVQIGIIGAIGDCYSSIAPDQVRDIYFKTGTALTALVKEEATLLRQLGADIIVYSIHDGGVDGLAGLGSYYDVSLSDGYVDLVFEGHSHSQYSFRDAYGVPHLQGGAENRGMSRATVTFNLATRETEIKTSYVPNTIYDDSEPHSIVAGLLEKYREDIAKGDQVLGHNSSTLDGYYLRELVAKLYYEAGVARWGQEYNITLGGGFISIRSPGRLTAGNVLYEDLYSMFPFDNELVLCTIQGNDLIRRFLETDNENYFVYYEDLEQIDPYATYYVIVDSYSSTYRPNHLTEVERYGAPVYARDLLASYISEGKLAVAPDPDAYVLTDIPTLLEICAALKPSRVSTEYYCVMGKVVSIDNRTYGNMTIEDEEGNRLYIYGVNGPDGTRYDALEHPPQVGDTVVLYGQMKNYVPDYGSPILEMVYTELIYQE